MSSKSHQLFTISGFSPIFSSFFTSSIMLNTKSDISSRLTKLSSSENLLLSLSLYRTNLKEESSGCCFNNSLISSIFVPIFLKFSVDIFSPSSRCVSIWSVISLIEVYIFSLYSYIIVNLNLEIISKIINISNIFINFLNFSLSSSDKFNIL